MLTLRDLQSSKTHQIPPAGIVLGREGGDADITVRDKSVSKHHARLYAMDGEWWLEDLNSANGTFVDDQKISGPVPLGPGVAFTLSNYQFEVVKIAGTDAGQEDDANGFGGDKSGPRTRVGGNPLDEDGDIAESTAPPPSRGGAKPKVAPRQQPSSPVKPARSAPPPPPRKSARAAAVDDDFEGGDPVDLQADPSLAGNPLTTLPKA